MAITKFDQFDFLIDIVPRDELKPPKRQVSQVGVAEAADHHALCILVSDMLFLSFSAQVIGSFLLLLV